MSSVHRSLCLCLSSLNLSLLARPCSGKLLSFSLVGLHLTHTYSGGNHPNRPTDEISSVGWCGTCGRVHKTSWLCCGICYHEAIWLEHTFLPSSIAYPFCHALNGRRAAGKRDFITHRHCSSNAYNTDTLYRVARH